MESELFDADYYERGIETGRSCYTNFRWMPELTLPMVMTYIDFLSITRKQTILDFGCAKGYVVKAFRLLYRKAWGCDISRYAIDATDSTVAPYLRLCKDEVVPFVPTFDWIIAKDVLEHIEEVDLPRILRGLKHAGTKMCAIIPLGENDRFNVPAYHLDKTHKLAKNLLWWINQFQSSGWKLIGTSYKVEGIKDNWAQYPEGNGFFVLGGEQHG